MQKNHGFGQRLKEERQRLGLKQTELAQKVDVSEKTISNYETGHFNTPLVEMAQLGIDIGYLVTGIHTSPKCLLTLKKALEDGDDWKPDKEFVIDLIKQYLEYLK